MEEKRVLGFDVTPALNFKTRADFMEFYLRPFLEKIEPGAFVVLYYSGHGFSYDGDSYLVPLIIPTSPASIAQSFIPVVSLRNTITGREPAMLLTILDACRTSVDFSKIVKFPDNGKLVKGFPEMTGGAGEIITYASAPSKPAFADSTGKLSVYTEALLQHIEVTDREWSDVKREVWVQVRQKTGQEQVPWFSESAGALLYFQASNERLLSFREQWTSTLQLGTYDAVYRFAEIYSLTPYGRAARQWLVENAHLQTMFFTQLSPILVDSAWNTDSSAPVIINKIRGAIGFDRVASGFGKEGVQPTSSAADILTHARHVVALGTVVARAEPDDNSPVVTTHGFLDRLAVKDTVPGRDTRSNWLRIVNYDQESFIRLDRNVRERPTQIGGPLLEFMLGPRPNSLPTLIDDEMVREVVNDLRKKGSKITWVSIATPRVPQAQERAILASQADNATVQLMRQGVPRGWITTVNDVDFNVGSGIRVRIFGEAR